MSVSLATTVGSSPTYQMPGAAQVLSDGSSLVIYRNASGSLALKYSTDRSTFTAKGTYSPASMVSGGWSATIDESDNLHLVWLDTANNMKYVKFTKAAGPTWTAGTAETVGAAAGLSFGPPGVEAMGGGVILVGWHEYPSSGVALQARFRLRTTGGTWSAQFSRATTNVFSANSSPTLTPPAMCRDIAGAASNQQAFAVITGGNHCSVPSPYAFSVMVVNVSTGALVSTTDIDLSLFGGADGSKVFAYDVFPQGAGAWYGVGGCIASTGKHQYYSWRSTTTTRSNTTFSEEAAFTSATGTGGIAYIQDRAAILETASGGAQPLTAKIISLVDGSWLPKFTMDSSPGGGSALLGMVGSGKRNYSQNHADVVMYSGTVDVRFTTNAANTMTTSGVTPSAGSTVNVNKPTLSATKGNSSGIAACAKWEFALDSGFTSILGSVVQDGTKYATSTFALAVSSDAYYTYSLHQAVFYVRAYTVDPWGQIGPASASSQFTVSHPPSAFGSSPGGDATFYEAGNPGSLHFTWTYSDAEPVDPQTAYQLLIERTDTGATVLDTGKVAATGNSALLFIPSGATDKPLRWSVRVWDFDDVQSVAFSTPLLFRASSLPVVTITAPTSPINTPGPVVSWSTVFTGTSSQAYYEVFVLDAAGTTTLFDSGLIAGSVTTYTIPDTSGIVNSTNYQIVVRVRDTAGLSGQASETVTATWTAPASPSFVISSTSYIAHGYVALTWTNAAKDADFAAWRLYRRVTGTSDWELLEETTTDDASYGFTDYLVANGESYDYVVVQVVTRFSTRIEGPRVPQSLIVPANPDYWLLHPTRGYDSYNVRLPIVVSDDYTDEYESAELLIKGRGRHRDYGTYWGVKGSLKVTLRDSSVSGESPETARVTRQRIELLKTTTKTALLRNPFGDMWLVALDDVQIGRLAGVGLNEFCDVTIPYSMVV